MVDQYASTDIEETQWLIRSRGHCLKIVMNNGNVHRYDGFKETVNGNKFHFVWRWTENEQSLYLKLSWVCFYWIKQKSYCQFHHWMCSILRILMIDIWCATWPRGHCHALHWGTVSSDLAFTKVLDFFLMLTEHYQLKAARAVNNSNLHRLVCKDTWRVA